MENKICQCCAMPMATDELHGTNADGSRNEDYCTYCYADGKIQFDVTMDEMVEACVPHLTKADPNMTEAAARKYMSDILPTLKYWKEKTA